MAMTMDQLQNMSLLIGYNTRYKVEIQTTDNNCYK